jgi:putative glutamine amidotransferase
MKGSQVERTDVFEAEPRLWNESEVRSFPEKPLIGVNMDHRSSRKGSPAFSFLGADYYDSIVRAGGVPVVIPPILDGMNRVLDLLDGVLLSGGADLDPRNDGFMLHPSVVMMDGRREEFDRKLVRLVAERRMPVFGIGVGMQLLNVSQGGNLLLHIPEDLPKALPHRDTTDPDHRHGLVIEAGSVMAEAYGCDTEVRVGSCHHMAVDIDEVAECFRITARSPDGVVEALEGRSLDEWFALGTQFHPESGSPLDLRILELFVEGVVRSKLARMAA